MKNVFRTAVVILSMAAIVSCGQGSEDTSMKKEDHSAHENTNTETPASTPAGVQLKDDKLNAVYQHYVHLTTALVNGDMAEAKVAGNAIETGAKQVEGGTKLAASASKITAASNLEAQRKEYSTLSDEMIDLAKKSGVNSGELYVDYCPMAMNDKGAYWLSSAKDIKNPYFGDKMLTCGEVKETIK